jgi:AraC family transcriptional regulator
MLILTHATAALHTVRAAIRRNGEAGRPVERLFVRMNAVGAEHEVVGMLDDRTDEVRVHKGPVDVPEATGSRSFGRTSVLAQERLRHVSAPSKTESDSDTPEGHGHYTWTARRGLSRRNLARACSYMEDNLGTKFTLDELARAVGISRFHFARLFRESTGESPMGYSLRLRIERAKAMLLQSDRRISAIAVTLGFVDQSHFSRTFRRITGISPGEYVRMRDVVEAAV